MDLAQQLVAWRRDFHAHPELGFCEYRTAARVCDVLAAVPGCKLRVGREVMTESARMGAPAPEDAAVARAEAIAAGANPKWVDAMGDGLTGVVAEWTFPRPGPTLAFRVDMDALPVTESVATTHAPARSGFISGRPGRMHACGHDGHTSIGLGLAQLVARRGAKWGGRLRIIFQPAEEGCAGAASMVEAGVVKDVDYFVAGHLGTAADETGLVSCGSTGFLATTKLDVTLRGVAAHAGMKPHEGRNALLAAATLTLQLHAITRHGAGDSRVNVGQLIAGSGRNIIADHAELKLEVRGSNTEINEFMTAEARRIIAATAAMHDVQATVKVVGAAQGAKCDAALKQIVAGAARSLPPTKRVVDSLEMPGSEDASCFMNAVQARGGQATYLLIGSRLTAGHHHPTFDFDEASLLHGVELYAAIADRILTVP
ncbi:MAG: amidohydrolase [Opitutaceae bacterium]|nr:amidohydrolase [Opitutaceae bacterium]